MFRYPFYVLIYSINSSGKHKAQPQPMRHVNGGEDDTQDNGKQDGDYEHDYENKDNASSCTLKKENTPKRSM